MWLEKALWIRCHLHKTLHEGVKPSGVQGKSVPRKEKASGEVLCLVFPGKSKKACKVAEQEEKGGNR